MGLLTFDPRLFSLSSLIGHLCPFFIGLLISLFLLAADRPPFMARPIFPVLSAPVAVYQLYF